MKKFFFILILFLSFSCIDDYTLPRFTPIKNNFTKPCRLVLASDNLEVFSPIDLDLDAIPKKTEITIRVINQGEQEIESFLVNGVVENLDSENKYKFKISKNTTVEVFFVHNVSLGLPDSISVIYPQGLDLNLIPSGTDITLRVNIPQGKVVKRFLVNDNEEDLDESNEYKFKISQDTEVEIVFVDIYILNLSNYVTVISPQGLDLNAIPSGTSITLQVDVPQGQVVTEFTVNSNIENLDDNNRFEFTINQNTIVQILLVNAYRLNLPEDGSVSVVSSQTLDYNSIPTGTNIILHVNVPDDKLVKEFRINSEIFSLDSSNEYSLCIEEDSDVEVDFQNAYSLTLGENLSIKSPQGLNSDKIPENTDITVKIDLEDYKALNKLKKDNEIVQTFKPEYIFDYDNNEIFLEYSISMDASHSLEVSYLDDWKLPSIERYEKVGDVIKLIEKSPGTITNSKILIPNFVTDIAENSFQNDSNLTDLKIMEGVRKICKKSFAGCVELKEVSVENGVTEIEESAFLSCSSLEVLILPDSITKLGASCFKNCSKLEEISKSQGMNGLPNSIEVIELAVFMNCSKLKRMKIPDCVTGIGMSSFRGCSNLESIEIPDGVKNIGNFAFYGCSKFQEIYIPVSVTYIGGSVFYGTTISVINCGISDPYPLSEPEGWDSNWKTGCSATVNWGQTRP